MFRIRNVTAFSLSYAAFLVLLAAPASAATQTISPAALAASGQPAQEAIQEALILAEPGDTVYLTRGTYHLTGGLSLDVDQVTVKGDGMDATILSFKGQEAGGEGLLVTSNQVVLTGFAVEDTKGDAVKAHGVDTITFRNIRTEWTGGPKETNGAYGLYPVSSRNVLIDGCIAVGASDAGIYVGQSENIIVRNSLAAFNVAGIEIENSYYADVYANEATHNTGGILIFDLPGLPQQGGHDIRVFGNKIIANDTPNFAPEGNIVGSVPKGTGIMVMANAQVEVTDNDLDDNATTHILLSTYPNDFDDDAYNPYPSAIHVHNNRLGRGGFAPDNKIGDLIASISGTPVPGIVWDGASPFWDYLFGPGDGQGIYVHGNISTEPGGSAGFINLDAPMWFAFKPFHGVSREPPDHDGPPPDIAPVTLPQDAG